MGYTLVYEQDWSGGNSTFSQKQYYDRVGDGADSLYPEANNAESVQVNTGDGPSGENTLDNWTGIGSDDDYSLEGVSLWLTNAASDGSALSIREGKASITYTPTTKSLADNAFGYCPLLVLKEFNDGFGRIFALSAYPNGAGPTWQLELVTDDDTVDTHTFTPVVGTPIVFDIEFKRDNGGAGYCRVYVDGVLIYTQDPAFIAGWPSVSGAFPAYPLRTAWIGFAGLFGKTTNFRLYSFAPSSDRNLLTGSTHTVEGSDNLIAGAGGSVTGDKNAYFALCSSPTPLVGDRIFKVCADEIVLEAASLSIGGASPSDYATKTGTETLTNKTLTTPNLAATIQVAGVRVALTDAQIKALPTTAIALVAAPAAGKRIQLVQACLIGDFTAGAYTNIGLVTPWLALRLGANDISTYIANDATATPAIATLTSFLSAALNQVTLTPLGLPTDNGWGVVPYVADPQYATALSIRAINDAAGNFTGGNAANSLVVDVVYLVIG